MKALPRIVCYEVFIASVVIFPNCFTSVVIITGEVPGSASVGQ